MTLKAMKEFAATWQSNLRLQEWDIKYRWMKKEEQSSDEFVNCNGFCVWNAQHKTAAVIISKSAESVHFTVIHELLHIRLEGHQELEGGTDIQLEVTINSLTAAFMSLVPQLYPELESIKSLNDY